MPAAPSLRRPRAVRADDAPRTAARLTLRRYSIMAVDSYHAMLERPGGDPLHDLRVSLRRLRVARQFYGHHGRFDALERVLPSLRELERTLGPLRDMDVWRGRMQRWSREHPRSAAGTAYQRALAGVLRRRQRAMAVHLRSRKVSSAVSRLSSWLRASAPRTVAAGPGAGAWAAARLRRACRQLRRVEAVDRSPDGLHRLRSRVRRARYYAEFSVEPVGKAAEQLRVRLKAVADALGMVHDMDVTVARTAIGRTPMPSWVRRHALHLRAKALRRFDRRWRRLQTGRAVRESLGELREYAKEARVRVYIIRHGIAVDIGEKGITRDADRVLSKRGRARARAVAAGLADLSFAPRLVLTSPLPRAAETARIMARVVRPRPDVQTCSHLRIGGDVGALVARLSRAKDGDIAVVGHQPQLGELVEYLAFGRHGRGMQLRKAGVCCIRFEEGVAPGGGEIEWLLPPRLLAREDGV